MAKFGGQVGAILCTAGGEKCQVKHSSLDRTMPGWRDGKLHVAECKSGQHVLIVDHKVGGHKMFTLTNNIKSKAYLESNPVRCVIALKDGPVIHINRSNPKALQALSATIDSISVSSKSSSAFSQSPFGQKTSPRSPYNKSHQPFRTSPQEGANYTSVKSVSMTPRTNPPTPQRKQVFSARQPGTQRLVDDDTIDDVDAENLGASMLFTDQMDKENQYIPSSTDRRSVLQMRKRGGGSLFMESFEEKQQSFSEKRASGPDPNFSVSTNFYSRGRQMSGYGGSDIFRSTPQTKVESSVKKRTPGFLPVPSGGNPSRLFSSVSSFGSGSRFSWLSRNKPSSSEASKLNLQGFSNLGNTCYMNAILQSLLGIQCFIQDLQRLEIIKAVPKTSLYKALSRLLFAKQNNKNSVEVGMRLQNVKAAISATATRFSGCMQHDAHEFLCQCLDQLKEDVEKVNNPKQNDTQDMKGVDSPPGQVVPSKEPETHARFVCAVSQNFELEVVHSILCQGCGEEVTKRETFNDISLDLPRSNEVFTLQTALDSFFSMEKLEYTCAKCDCKEASVTHKFTRLPRVLVLHLKRYTFDTEALSNAKLKRNIGIPRFLTLAWHSVKMTKPPPPRSGRTPHYVPLSPRRQNLQTLPASVKNPSNNSGSIRKRLSYENDSPPVFKFKKARTKSDSPKKEVTHFISRYDNDDRTGSDKDQGKNSGDRNYKEMDEAQQLAYVLELSRQEAEAKLSFQRNMNDDEPTDEELVQALAMNETKDSVSFRTSEGAVEKVDDSDTDEELPVGLTDNKEDEDLQRALAISKEAHDEQIKRQKYKDVADAGCHGNSTDDHNADDEMGIVSDVDEEMDTTTDDQPLAFSLDTGTGDNPTQPQMSEVDTKMVLIGRRSDLERGPEEPHLESCLQLSERFKSSDPARHDTLLSHGANSEKNVVSDNLDDEVSVLPEDSRDNRAEKDVQGSVQSNDSGHSSIDTSEYSLSIPGKDDSGVKLSTSKSDKDLTPWKPSGAGSRKNILEYFSPVRTSKSTLKEDLDISPEKEGCQELSPAKAVHVSPLVDLTTEEGASHSENRGDDKSKERIMSYEEMKAKEDEEIRLATELSLKEAKEMEDKEAAELQKAQEMSLQEFHQSEAATPKHLMKSSEPTRLSPVYTEQEVEMLSKHSEDGHLHHSYRLVSIVSHIGSSSAAGHYVSDVYDPEKESWLSYDDSDVMKRTESSLREDRQRTGYIFFYQAKEFL